jgi:F-type H+-transporting ATPase subunit b
MMLRIVILASVLASPAAAAEGYPFFSLYNTDLVVLAAFLIFCGVLVYAKVPGKLSAFLDSRAETIKAELDEARRLREEALELHASFERKQAEVKEQAARIVEKAKADAQLAAEQTKAEIEASIARRLKAAEDQIASAEASAVRQVRDRATSVAVAAASSVIAKNMDDARGDTLVANAIKAAGERLH